MYKFENRVSKTQKWYVVVIEIKTNTIVHRTEECTSLGWCLEQARRWAKQNS